MNYPFFFSDDDFPTFRSGGTFYSAVGAREFDDDDDDDDYVPSFRVASPSGATFYSAVGVPEFDDDDDDDDVPARRTFGAARRFFYSAAGFSGDDDDDDDDDVQFAYTVPVQTQAVSTQAVVPQVQTFSAPQVQAYAAPQVQTYSAPQVQTFSAPQVQTYAAPQVQTYSAPQTYNVPSSSSVQFQSADAQAAVQPQVIAYSAQPAAVSYVQKSVQPTVHTSTFAQPIVYSYSASPSAYTSAVPSFYSGVFVRPQYVSPTFYSARFGDFDDDDDK